MKNCEICGRERGDMNPTNWNRHVKSCRLKTSVAPKPKRNLNNTSIKEFFNKKIKLERIGATNSNGNTENEENNQACPSVLNRIDDQYEQSMSICATSNNDHTVNVENNETCSSILNRIHDQYEQSMSTENIIFQETLCISTSTQSNMIYENDPAKFHTFTNVTPEFTDMLVRKGPCQPTNNIFKFPTNEEHRSFQESWFTKKLNDGTLVNRDWLSYSISTDNMFCFHCQMYGKTKRDNWIINGVSKWKNALHKILVHETSTNHIDASLKFKLRNQVLPILPSLTEKRKFEVLCNRGIVKELIDITFRGHREKWSDSLRGNFKDLVELVSNYSPTMAPYISNLKNKNNKPQWSFISWRIQNELIECISDDIVGIISKSIKDSPFFSVSLDTTFDVSRKEQLSFIVRYIDKNSGSIYERLIAVLETPITTDWKNHLVGQSYDDAANMRGNYNGLQSLIKEINPHAIYVWCWAHRLNLVITDVVSSGVNAMDIVKYYEQFQKERYKKKQIRRTKHVTTTRWMSFSYALDVVLSTYLAAIDTLEIIRSKDGPGDRKTGFEAGAINDYKRSYRFVWTALTFKKLFDILSPTSSILQSKDLDLMLAVSMIEQNKIKISTLRSDESFEHLSQEVDVFFLEQGDENEELIQLPTPRLRKKKKMPGELSDDELILDPIQNIKVNTYFSALDIVQRQLSERFNDESIGVLKDLSLLTKYLQFASIFDTLITSKALPNALHSKCEEIFGSESEPESDDGSDKEDTTSKNIVSNIKNNSGSLQPIFQIFLNKGLISVFPNVYTMLKIGLTLPVTSASPERAFSKLKIVKNRLHSTMGQERLQGLMRITCEKDITINYENIINNFASKSPHLKKALIL
ncbi:PREDICTED: zinc finger MYM-type protein 1-like [Diuraphis noxia]|uniref:zinc finger MYM-type protein 1-like n=1 Tax=Diuraphis noxia TaxID=143948 RepID=UPI0007638BB8|nr:PREDICTED: zinc finger MYM-type protein 1-like [Diuraphis noxia]